MAGTKASSAPPAEDFGSFHGKAIGPVSSFDGTAIHVEEIGAGQTVVFSHGLCLSRESWHYQMRDLASEHRLVLYDQRGHGLSAMPATGDWSMEAFARDLDAVVSAVVRDEPVVVVGHSMGGMSLLKYAAMFPEALGSRVAGLALVDTAARDVIGGMLPGAAKAARPALKLVEEAAMRAASRNPDAFDRLRKSRRDLVMLMVRLMGFGPKAPPQELAFVERMLSATSIETLVWVLHTLRTMDVTLGLDDIDTPTMVVVGSRDRLTPPTGSLAIANAIHCAELTVIKGAGHMPMLEKPDVFNARLRAFLKSPGAVYGGRRIGGPHEVAGPNV